MTGRATSDEELDELARRAKRGDPVAFDLLCRSLSDDVWRYCYALLGDREQAFDASQDTFMRAVKAITTWRGDAPIRVFLLVLARRAVADVIRQAQRRRRIDDLATDVSVGPTGVTPAELGQVELAELVDQLDDEQRQAFVLTQVIGLSYDEAAEVAGVAIGTIRSRVHRARSRLAAAIADAEGDTT